MLADQHIRIGFLGEDPFRNLADEIAALAPHLRSTAFPDLVRVNECGARLSALQSALDPNRIPRIGSDAN